MKRFAPVVHDLFNPPGDSGIVNNEPSLTRQSHKNECDINFLMERYERIGVFHDPSDPVSNRVLQFGDFSDFDYLSAMNAVVDANERFSSLPARLRARFDNDPAKLLHFLSDSSNRDEAISLGLLDQPKADPPAAPASTEPPAQLPT